MKILKVIISVFITLCFSSISLAEIPPSIFINGKLLYCQNPPVIEADRVLVPLRAIFEALNQRVSWNMNDQSITSGNIWLQIGNPVAKVGDKQITLDVPAAIINERTYVPLRFVAESLGKKVTWDNINNKININDDTYRLKLKSTKELIDANSSGYQRVVDEVLSLWTSCLDDIDHNRSVTCIDRNIISMEYNNIFNNLNNKDKEIAASIESLAHPDTDNLEAYNALTDYYKTYRELRSLATTPGGSYNGYKGRFNELKKRLSLSKTNLELILG